MTDFRWSHAGVDQTNVNLSTLSADQKQQYIMLLVHGYLTTLELRRDGRQMRGAVEAIGAGERDLAQIKKAESRFEGEP